MLRQAIAGSLLMLLAATLHGGVRAERNYEESCNHYQCEIDQMMSEILGSKSQTPVYILILLLYYIAGLILMTIGFILLLDKRFKAFPFPLIAWASLAEALTFFTFDSTIYSQFPQVIADLNDITFKPLSYVIEIPDFYYTIGNKEYLFNFLINMVLNIVGLGMSVATNFLIFIELYWTIKNPFFPREAKGKRYNFILLVAFVVSLGVGIARAFHSYREFQIEHEGHRSVGAILWANNALLVIFLFGLPLFITILIQVRLNSKGTSKELKQSIISRLTIMMALYLVITFTIIIRMFVTQHYVEFRQDYDEEQFESFAHFYTAMSIINSIAAILLAVSRIYEPFARSIFRRLFFKVVTCGRSKRRGSRFSKTRAPRYQEEHPQIQFLNSAMNVELVSLILLGIQIFMSKQMLTLNEDAKNQLNKKKITGPALGSSSLQNDEGVYEEEQEPRFTTRVLKSAEQSKVGVQITKLDFGQIIFTNEQDWDVCQDPQGSPSGARSSAKSMTRKSKTKIEKIMETPFEDEDDPRPFGFRASTTFFDKGTADDREDNSFDHLMEGLEQFQKQQTMIGGQSDPIIRIKIEDYANKSEISVNLNRQSVYEHFMNRSQAHRRESKMSEKTQQAALSQTQDLKMMIKSRIISYADDKFSKIMKLDGIKPDEVQQSLSLEVNRRNIFKSGHGAGKSGSFFFFSNDKRFIVKTMVKAERIKFLAIVDDYIQHIQKTKNKSLIARIYGIFSLRTELFKPVDVMIMQNTAYLNSVQSNLVKFDIKGSTINRYVKLPPHDQHFWQRRLQTPRVMKDMNYIEINQDMDGTLMVLDFDKYSDIKRILKQDSMFLRKHGLMDYSLLLAIETPNDRQPQTQEENVEHTSMENQRLNEAPSIKKPQLPTFGGGETLPTKPTMSSTPADLDLTPARSKSKLEFNFEDLCFQGPTTKPSFALQSFYTKPKNSLFQPEGEVDRPESNRVSRHQFSGKTMVGINQSYASISSAEDDDKHQEAIYHLGIIDFLQEWNFKKRSERFLKNAQALGRIGDGLSALEPDQYQERFHKFITTNILKPALDTSQRDLQSKEAFIQSLQ